MINNNKFAIYILVFFNIICLVSGQILWKIGIGKLPKKDIISIALSVFSPHILIGIVVYSIATVLWLAVISKAGDKMSVIYPMQSLAYVLFVLASYWLFNEKIHPTGWIGISLIVIGIFLIAI